MSSMPSELSRPVASVHVDTLNMINDATYRWPHVGGAKLWPPSRATHDDAYVALYTRDQHVEITDLRRRIGQLSDENATLKREVEDLKRRAALYDVLEMNASEQLFNPRAANSEILPDMRTCWKLPTMMCSGPVGGYTTFEEAVSLLPGGLNARAELE